MVKTYKHIGMPKATMDANQWPEWYNQDLEHLMTIIIYNTCEYIILKLHVRRVLQCLLKRFSNIYIDVPIFRF